MTDRRFVDRALAWMQNRIVNEHDLAALLRDIDAEGKEHAAMVCDLRAMGWRIRGGSSVQESEAENCAKEIRENAARAAAQPPEDSK